MCALFLLSQVSMGRGQKLMSPEERRMCPTGVFLLRTVCVSSAWIWFTLCRCSAVKPCFFLPTWNTENSPRRQPYWQFVALKHRKTSPRAVLPSGSMSLTLLLQQKLLCQMLFVTTQFTWTWLWKPAHRTGCLLEKNKWAQGEPCQPSSSTTHGSSKQGLVEFTSSTCIW